MIKNIFLALSVGALSIFAFSSTTYATAIGQSPDCAKTYPTDWAKKVKDISSTVTSGWLSYDINMPILAYDVIDSNNPEFIQIILADNDVSITYVSNGTESSQIKLKNNNNTTTKYTVTLYLSSTFQYVRHTTLDYTPLSTRTLNLSKTSSCIDASKNVIFATVAQGAYPTDTTNDYGDFPENTAPTNFATFNYAICEYNETILSTSSECIAPVVDPPASSGGLPPEQFAQYVGISIAILISGIIIWAFRFQKV